MDKKKVALIFIIIFSSITLRQILFNTPKMPLDKTTLTFENGTIFEKSALQNKVSIISFYQTWCGDCRAEQKDLLQLHQQYGDKLQILFVSDEEWAKVDEMKNHLQTTDLTFLKSNKSLKSIGIRRFPTTYLVDKNGKVRLNKVEAKDWNTPEMKKIIESLIAKIML